MTQPSDAPLTFIDGVAVDSDDIRLYLACGFTTSNVAESRMLLLSSEGKWGRHDVNSRVRSVDVGCNPFTFYALGKDGMVSLGDRDGIKFEFISDAGTGINKYGYVKRIRHIGEQLYVCGDLHQVYRRSRNAWAHIDNGILIKDYRAVGRSLNDIHGMDEADIYTVGDRGVIFHYDGKKWQEIISPTNCNLERVLCRSKDEIYACGAHGTLLRGNKNGMEIIQTDDQFRETLWGLAWFQDKIYVTSVLNIWMLNGQELQKVEHGITVSGSYNRLSASKNTLWSIGVNDLLTYDGHSWLAVEYSSPNP
jgi:hypothetical protein